MHPFKPSQKLIFSKILEFLWIIFSLWVFWDFYLCLYCFRSLNYYEELLGYYTIQTLDVSSGMLPFGTPAQLRPVHGPGLPVERTPVGDEAIPGRVEAVAGEATGKNIADG